MHKTPSFFALDEPDVSVEVGDRGLYRGREALMTLFEEQFGSASLKGNLLFPFLTTGSIQIAVDGKTAKGVWRSPCAQAVMPKDGNGEPDPIWLFGAYAGEQSFQPLQPTLVNSYQSTSSGRVTSGRFGTSTGSGL